MAESPGQCSVVNITVLWGVSPMAQFMSNVVIRANTQMSQWLGRWASMHNALLWHKILAAWYWCVSVGMGTNMLRVAWWVYLWVVVAAGQNSWLICLLHICRAQEEVNSRVVRDYLKWVNQYSTKLHEPERISDELHVLKKCSPPLPLFSLRSILLISATRRGADIMAIEFRIKLKNLQD